MKAARSASASSAGSAPMVAGPDCSAPGALAPRLLSPDAAAAYLGLTRRDLLSRARRGEIGAVRAPGVAVACRRTVRGRVESFTYQREVVRFRVTDLDAWIALHYRPASTPVAPAAPIARGLKPWERIPAHQREF